MALDTGQFGDQDTMITLAADASEERGVWWTPGPVRLEHAPAAPQAPIHSEVITGSFQFPSDLVEARAQELVERARRTGQRHTLSLWESALRDALEGLARAAAHAPDAAACSALFWERDEAGYRVAATFAARGMNRQTPQQ